MAGAAALGTLACLAPGTASADGPPQLTRYSIVHGCYALRSEQTGQWVRETGAPLPLQPGYAATAATPAEGEPFRMQATDLGRYLFYGSGADFLARHESNSVIPAASPSDNSDWTVNEDGNAFRIVNEFAGRDLAVDGAGNLVTVAAGGGGAAGLFTLDPVNGCADYPEVEVNVTGQPATRAPYAPVKGLVETHMHHMAFEFLGTKAHCGRPWHRFGAPFALKDCDDHTATNGCGAVLETALSGTTCHDPGGWPGFAGWPDHRQYTHEQSYYKWVERAWRGGLRVFVMLAVENRVLCEIYPLTPQPSRDHCNEMDTVRRELEDARALERYIDAQSGGPGKGWYRIVEDPVQARRVINDGKLAVILGMEVSEPFDCRLMQPGDVPTCDEQDVKQGIDELYDLGVRQLELVNKFDNALTGVAGDSGSTGAITNLGNFYSAGTFWDMEACEDPHNHDKDAMALNHNDDVLIARGLDEFGDQTGLTLPVYGNQPYCNQRGLSDLGELAVKRLMSKGMIFDPDHMSVLARNRALDLVQDANYGGVMTSHSWSTDNALPRISEQGGFIGPAAKSPEGFVSEWNNIRAHGYDALDPYLFGIGYGADMNGFASQGGPPAPEDQITYPFDSLVDPGVSIGQQVSGTKTFDYNQTGTAHYGLYPDWAEAVSRLGGPEITEDLTNGAEAYLQMWERASGITPPTGSGQPPAGGEQPRGGKPKCPGLHKKLKKAKSKKAKRKLRKKIRKRGC
jgi:microsomal dipeptidase-like Zn-dependent dipeptidase